LESDLESTWPDWPAFKQLAGWPAFKNVTFLELFQV
jgi:hypothetical protein